MAYCRLGHIKENKGAGGKSIGLKRCIEYIFNPKKTDNQQLIGGYNITVDKQDAANAVYEQMLLTKSAFGKTDGRQGYHYKLSFAQVDSVSPELAMEITNEFCRRCFGGYECAYSVHTNTDHIHSHIVFNSIDIYEGRKYHYKKGDWAGMIQPVANEICKMYGLSELDLNLDNELRLKHKCKSYGEWVKETDKKVKKPLNYTNKMIRADVDECIKNSKSYDEFKDKMNQKGHVLNDQGKHLTILAPGRTRPCRAYVLSPDKMTYTKENIQRMIEGTYLSVEEVRMKLFEGWEAYQTECRRIVVQSVRLTPEFAKMMEERNFRAQHNIHNQEELSLYQYQLECMDKQLNVMKKHIKTSYEAEQSNILIMSELVSLMDAYKKYEQTKSERYIAAYDRANELYQLLCDKSVDLEQLYVFAKSSEKLIADIDAYKKHIYVEKRICGRLERSMKNEPHKPQETQKHGK